MDTLMDLVTRVTELIDSISASVTDSPVTYLIIFALAAVDVVFPILPSEATATAAGVLAGTGQLTLVWIIVAVGLGAFIGDNVAYWIGRLAGRPVAERVLRGRAGQLEDVEAQFDRRGGLFIIIGRFVPGGRTVVALGSGVLEFPWTRFVLYDAIAAAVWSVQVTLPGFIGGVVVQDRPWLAQLIGFGLAFVVAGAIALIQRWFERRGRDRPADDAQADAE